MAKATITLTDKENGDIDIHTDFDPPIEEGPDGLDVSFAQVFAIDLLQRIKAEDVQGTLAPPSEDEPLPEETNNAA
jgi:hypothetical protein